MDIPPIRDDGLQLEEHRDFQKILWMIERVAWIAFVLILLGALAGLTGSGGYLSRNTTTLATGVVEVPRVARREASDEISITFGAGREDHHLLFGRRFDDYFEIESIQPEPEQTMGSPAGTRMQFAAERSASMHVVVHVRPLRPGLPQYSIYLDDARAEVAALILP